MKKLFVVLSLLLSLQGCVAAFIVGAAAGGIIVYDRRTIQTIADDQSITYLTSDRIATLAKQYPNSHIVVVTFNHMVLLVGETPDASLRRQCTQMAQYAPKVTRVFNYIQISGANSAMERASDSLVTSKVRTAMLTARDLKSTQIKVVTENGVTYLMGILSRDQASLASRVAQRIGGVQKVVTLFDYTD